MPLLGVHCLRTYITIKDILQRKHFEDIEIVAGETGLDRSVKWVHVVDVSNIRNLLNGGELILSTGVAWKENKEIFISIVQQLIESGAAGLCIEIGTYLSSIPHEIIEIANQHHFPLICFKKEVPFVEITQDIHTLLINHQYKIISDLENYSQELNKKLITMKQYDEILLFIHQYLKLQVILIINNKESHFVPKLSQYQQKALIEQIEKMMIPPSSIAKVPIKIFGDQYADLMIISYDRILTEFDQLILDRTATALTQFFLRELYVEEKRKVKEIELMKKWLDGELTKEQILKFLSFHLSTITIKGGVVCLFKLDSQWKYSNLDMTYFKLYFRTILEQNGFSLFSIEQKNMLIAIIINHRSSISWKERLKECLQKVEEYDFHGENEKIAMKMAIGKYVEDLTSFYVSYQSALETLQMQLQETSHFSINFYDDLHIFRIISLLNKHIDLHEIIYEYLEPIITYDKKYNGKLLETLKTYLACNGSKQETAKRLYIVRQTLYHRLEKIEKLIGKDFMDQEKRLAIEFMIFAYTFLQSSERKDVFQSKSI